VVEKTMILIDEKETNRRIKRVSRKSIWMTIVAFIAGMVVGPVISPMVNLIIPPYMKLPSGFWAGLILGGIVGFVIGFSLNMAFESKGKRSIKKESKAENLFNLAIQQESQERKRELLGKVLDKYPRSKWADKALEESMKMRSEN